MNWPTLKKSKTYFGPLSKEPKREIPLPLNAAGQGMLGAWIEHAFTSGSTGSALRRFRVRVNRRARWYLSRVSTWARSRFCDARLVHYRRRGANDVLLLDQLSKTFDPIGTLKACAKTLDLESILYISDSMERPPLTNRAVLKQNVDRWLDRSGLRMRQAFEDKPNKRIYVTAELEEVDPQIYKNRNRQPNV